MNKAQRITITVALLIMAVILLFPPVGRIRGNQFKFLIPQGRALIFSLGELIQINTLQLIVELAAIICVGAAMAMLFGLKAKRSQKDPPTVVKGK